MICICSNKKLDYLDGYVQGAQGTDEPRNEDEMAGQIINTFLQQMNRFQIGYYVL